MNQIIDTIYQHGIEVSVFRSSIDDRIVINIVTDQIDESDQHEGGVPDIAITINDHEQRIDENGLFIPRWDSTDRPPDYIWSDGTKSWYKNGQLVNSPPEPSLDSGE